MKGKRKPKGWVDNPKTLYDIMKSLEALGCSVETRLSGDRRQVVKKAKKIRIQ